MSGRDTGVRVSDGTSVAQRREITDVERRNRDYKPYKREPAAQRLWEILSTLILTSITSVLFNDILQWFYMQTYTKIPYNQTITRD